MCTRHGLHHQSSIHTQVLDVNVWPVQQQHGARSQQQAILGYLGLETSHRVDSRTSRTGCYTFVGLQGIDASRDAVLRCVRQWTQTLHSCLSTTAPTRLGGTQNLPDLAMTAPGAP